jgi:hypothetical protein
MELISYYITDVFQSTTLWSDGAYGILITPTFIQYIFPRGNTWERERERTQKSLK